MKLEKAEIIVLDAVGRQKKRIPVMYNPTTYGIGTSAETSGTGSNITFERVNLEDFSVSLFYDSYEEGTDVRRKIDPLAELMQPTVGVKDVKRPPICLFRWGNFSFKGIIVQLQQRFTMFAETGIPVRGTVDVTLKCVLTPNEDKKETGRDACRQLWKVRAGDRLDLVAAQTMGDPGQWPSIARTNGIEDPLGFPRPADLGTFLAIPDLTAP